MSIDKNAHNFYENPQRNLFGEMRFVLKGKEVEKARTGSEATKKSFASMNLEEKKEKVKSMLDGTKSNADGKLEKWLLKDKEAQKFMRENLFTEDTKDKITVSFEKLNNELGLTSAEANFAKRHLRIGNLLEEKRILKIKSVKKTANGTPHEAKKFLKNGTKARRGVYSVDNQGKFKYLAILEGAVIEFGGDVKEVTDPEDFEKKILKSKWSRGRTEVKSAGVTARAEMGPILAAGTGGVGDTTGAAGRREALTPKDIQERKDGVAAKAKELGAADIDAPITLDNSEFIPMTFNGQKGVDPSWENNNGIYWRKTTYKEISLYVGISVRAYPKKHKLYFSNRKEAVNTENKDTLEALIKAEKAKIDEEANPNLDHLNPGQKKWVEKQRLILEATGLKPTWEDNKEMPIIKLGSTEAVEDLEILRNVDVTLLQIKKQAQNDTLGTNQETLEQLQLQLQYLTKSYGIDVNKLKSITFAKSGMEIFLGPIKPQIQTERTGPGQFNGLALDSTIADFPNINQNLKDYYSDQTPETTETPDTIPATEIKHRNFSESPLYKKVIQERENWKESWTKFPKSEIENTRYRNYEVEFAYYNEDEDSALNETRTEEEIKDLWKNLDGIMPVKDAFQDFYIKGRDGLPITSTQIPKLLAQILSKGLNNDIKFDHIFEFLTPKLEAFKDDKDIIELMIDDKDANPSEYLTDPDKLEELIEKISEKTAPPSPLSAENFKKAKELLGRIFTHIIRPAEDLLVAISVLKVSNAKNIGDREAVTAHTKYTVNQDQTAIITGLEGLTTQLDNRGSWSQFAGWATGSEEWVSMSDLDGKTDFIERNELNKGMTNQAALNFLLYNDEISSVDEENDKRVYDPAKVQALLKRYITLGLLQEYMKKDWEKGNQKPAQEILDSKEFKKELGSELSFLAATAGAASTDISEYFSHLNKRRIELFQTGLFVDFNSKYEKQKVNIPEDTFSQEFAQKAITLAGMTPKEVKQILENIDLIGIYKPNILNLLEKEGHTGGIGGRASLGKVAGGEVSAELGWLYKSNIRTGLDWTIKVGDKTFHIGINLNPKQIEDLAFTLGYAETTHYGEEGRFKKTGWGGLFISPQNIKRMVQDGLSIDDIFKVGGGGRLYEKDEKGERRYRESQILTRQEKAEKLKELITLFKNPLTPVKDKYEAAKEHPRYKKLATEEITEGISLDEATVVALIDLDIEHNLGGQAAIESNLYITDNWVPITKFNLGFPPTIMFRIGPSIIVSRKMTRPEAERLALAHADKVIEEDIASQLQEEADETKWGESIANPGSTFIDKDGFIGYLQAEETVSFEDHINKTKPQDLNDALARVHMRYDDAKRNLKINDIGRIKVTYAHPPKRIRNTAQDLTAEEKKAMKSDAPDSLRAINAKKAALDKAYIDSLQTEEGLYRDELGIDTPDYDRIAQEEAYLESFQEGSSGVEVDIFIDPTLEGDEKFGIKTDGTSFTVEGNMDNLVITRRRIFFPAKTAKDGSSLRDTIVIKKRSSVEKGVSDREIRRTGDSIQKIPGKESHVERSSYIQVKGYGPTNTVADMDDPFDTETQAALDAAKATAATSASGSFSEIHDFSEDNKLDKEATPYAEFQAEISEARKKLIKNAIDTEFRNSSFTRALERLVSRNSQRGYKNLLKRVFNTIDPPLTDKETAIAQQYMFTAKFRDLNKKTLKKLKLAKMPTAEQLKNPKIRAIVISYIQQARKFLEIHAEYVKPAFVRSFKASMKRLNRYDGGEFDIEKDSQTYADNLVRKLLDRVPEVDTSTKDTDLETHPLLTENIDSLEENLSVGYGTVGENRKAALALTVGTVETVPRKNEQVRGTGFLKDTLAKTEDDKEKSVYLETLSPLLQEGFEDSEWATQLLYTEIADTPVLAFAAFANYEINEKESWTKEDYATIIKRKNGGPEFYNTMTKGSSEREQFNASINKFFKLCRKLREMALNNESLTMEYKGSKLTLELNASTGSGLWAECGNPSITKGEDITTTLITKKGAAPITASSTGHVTIKNTSHKTGIEGGFTILPEAKAKAKPKKKDDPDKVTSDEDATVDDDAVDINEVNDTIGPNGEPISIESTGTGTSEAF
ncbi:hypothetical protein HOE67_03265 [Candidatus Peregrinibacteria bacterium]|jgi:hypothetical protein|nr:hypothetical protein [Candidatus Peregrinibacteria bacterium]MBT4056105.1 hypothetical protein [Candidatus Peregrinibacteria bacterium]